MAQGFDSFSGKGGDGGMLKNAESGWLSLAGINSDLSKQFQTAPKLDLASAGKHLPPASIDASGFTFAAKTQADDLINNAGRV